MQTIIITFASLFVFTSVTAFLLKGCSSKRTSRKPTTSYPSPVFRSVLLSDEYSQQHFIDARLHRYDDHKIGQRDHPYVLLLRKQQQSIQKTNSDTEKNRRNITIYCDLDGVLVDFEHGVRQVFPDVMVSNYEQFPIQELKQRNLLWNRIASSGSFFEKLPWVEGGKQLWNALRRSQTKNQINILTGVPEYQEARIEKFRWCQRELNIPVKHVDKAGPLLLHKPSRYHDQQKTYRVTKPEKDHRTIVDYGNFCNVITCWSEYKHHESGPGAVLIDDRIDLKDAWERKGGIFIHHKTGNTANTLEKLINKGIFDEEDIDSDQNK